MCHKIKQERVENVERDNFSGERETHRVDVKHDCNSLYLLVFDNNNKVNEYYYYVTFTEYVSSPVAFFKRGRNILWLLSSSVAVPIFLFFIPNDDRDGKLCINLKIYYNVPCLIYQNKKV